jgi:hypothetical protein
VIIGEKAPVEKNKHAAGYPLEWPNHVKVNPLMSFLSNSFLAYSDRCFSMGTVPDYCG